MVEVIKYLDDVIKEADSRIFGKCSEYIDGDLEKAIVVLKSQHAMAGEVEVVRDERLTTSSHLIITKAKDNSYTATYLLLLIL